MIKTVMIKIRALTLPGSFKKSVEHGSDDYRNFNWFSWYRDGRVSRDYQNYSIVKIGQNTTNSPGDLRRLAVTQNSSERPSENTDVKNSQGAK